MKLLRTFDKPTDVYIIGMGYKGENLFKITDDYSGFCLKSDKHKHHFESDGFVNIFTKEEFIAAADRAWDDKDELIEVDGCEGMIIRDYVGDLKLEVLEEQPDGTTVIDISDGLDLSEYIQSQRNLDGWMDVNIVVTSGFKLDWGTVGKIYEGVL